MENELLSSIQILLEKIVSKSNSTVTASMITVGGMLGIAFFTTIVQWITTKTVTRSEFKIREYENWQNRFQDVSSDLLKELDPTLNLHNNNEEKCVALIHKTQMMLNLEIPSHAKVNHYINELGLSINQKTTKYDYNDSLKLHIQLIDAIREIISIDKKRWEELKF